jgi:hypothetical protein
MSTYTIAQKIEFYEGNYATEDLVCRIELPNNTHVRVNFKNDKLSCENDEARSAVLLDVPRGRIIRLYDSPSGKRNDDWVEIRTQVDIQRAVINTFESNDSGVPGIDITYHKKNELDGKVSLLIAGPPMSDPCDEVGLLLRQEGNRLIAEGGVGCPVAHDLELRIRENIKIWPDRNLVTERVTGSEISASYTCKRGEGMRVFAELKVNGKKKGRTDDLTATLCH